MCCWSSSLTCSSVLVVSSMWSGNVFSIKHDLRCKSTSSACLFIQDSGEARRVERLRQLHFLMHQPALLLQPFVWVFSCWTLNH